MCLASLAFALVLFEHVKSCCRENFFSTCYRRSVCAKIKNASSRFKMHEKQKETVETALKHDAVSPCTEHKVVNIAHPPNENLPCNHPGKLNRTLPDFGGRCLKRRAQGKALQKLRQNRVVSHDLDLQTRWKACFLKQNSSGNSEVCCGSPISKGRFRLMMSMAILSSLI